MWGTCKLRYVAARVSNVTFLFLTRMMSLLPQENDSPPLVARNIDFFCGKPISH
jgi:hypothetical protein